MAQRTPKRPTRSRIVGRAARPRSRDPVEQPSSRRSATEQDGAATLGSSSAPELDEVTYRERLAELRRLPSSSVTRINLSVPSLVATVLGVVPKLRAQLPALRAAVVQFDFELVSSLEEWALVLNKLHAAALIPEERSPISAAEIAEARQLRRLLHSDALGLVKRGLLSQSDLESIGQSSGFVNLARDLNQLHRLFTVNAHSLSGRCAVTEPELSRALELANRLTKLIAQRAHPTPHKGAELERRAYTKLLAAYREARSGILFLRRHEGDGDDIIPSLFIGRGGRGANEKSATNARNRQTAATDASPTESLSRPFETVGSPTSAPNERKKKQ